MLAIIETGGKQYTVTEGSILDVEKLGLEKGAPVAFDKVLLYSDDKATAVGQPYLENVKVSGTVLNNIKADKVIVFKFKRKTGYQKKQGHRQNYTTVKIESIKA